MNAAQTNMKLQLGSLACRDGELLRKVTVTLRGHGSVYYQHLKYHTLPHSLYVSLILILILILSSSSDRFLFIHQLKTTTRQQLASLSFLSLWVPAGPGFCALSNCVEAAH